MDTGCYEEQVTKQLWETCRPCAGSGMRFGGQLECKTCDGARESYITVSEIEYVVFSCKDTNTPA